MKNQIGFQLYHSVGNPAKKSPPSQEYGNYKIDPCLNYNYLLYE